jgi:hypothetical protein
MTTVMRSYPRSGRRVWRGSGGLQAIWRTTGLLLVNTVCTPQPFGIANSHRESCADALMMHSNNSPFAVKSCECLPAALLAGVIRWYVGSTTVHLKNSVS